MKRDDENNVISPKYWQAKNEAYYVFKANITSLEQKLNVIIEMLEHLMDKPHLKTFMRPNEVAATLGLTQRSIYTLIKEGRLKAHKAGNSVYVERNSVMEYVTQKNSDR